METTSWQRLLALPVCLCVLAQPVLADQALDLTPLPMQSSPTQWLASNDTNMPAESAAFANNGKPDQGTAFETPLFSGNKVHQYLGLGALGLLALAIVSPKEEDGPHEYFATGSAVLGAAAATSGLIYHWDDFDFDDGLSDPDNLHMMLGSAGTLLMLAAISQAPEGGHAGLGIVGGVAMGVAVKMTW